MKLTSDFGEERLLREIGKRMAGQRLERNMTQAQLAERAGVSRRTVERLEAGSVGTQRCGAESGRSRKEHRISYG